jgi:hypothetical protein
MAAIKREAMTAAKKNAEAVTEEQVEAGALVEAHDVALTPMLAALTMGSADAVRGFATRKEMVSMPLVAAENVGQPKGYVYFLVEHPWRGLVKIGNVEDASESLWTRINNLQTGNPAALVLWWAVQPTPTTTAKELELSFHNVLAAKQLRAGGGTEWFKLSLVELETIIFIVMNDADFNARGETEEGQFTAAVKATAVGGAPSVTTFVEQLALINTTEACLVKTAAKLQRASWRERLQWCGGFRRPAIEVAKRDADKVAQDAAGTVQSVDGRNDAEIDGSVPSADVTSFATAAAAIDAEHCEQYTAAASLPHSQQ